MTLIKLTKMAFLKNISKKIFCFLSLSVLFSSMAFSADAKKTKEAREAAREREKARVERKAAADKQDAYEEAVETFQLNKPAEAIPLLEAFLGDDKHEAYSPDVYVYLSAAYYQVEEYQKSIDVCEAGLSKEDTNYKVLYFNEGNAAYALGQYMKAASLYEKSREIDAQYAPATLNLANAFLRQDKIEEARDDYVLYLELKPDTKQRPEIERLIALLNEEIDYRKRLGPELVDDLIRSQIDDGSEGPHEIMSDSEAEAPELPLEKLQKINGEQLDSDESVAPELPVERNAKKINGEQLDSSESVAPALPVERNAKKINGEQLDSSESAAPELPVERNARKINGEQLDSSESAAPELPAERNARKINGEQLDSSESAAPALPADKGSRRTGEQVNSSDSQAPALPKDSGAKKKGEYIDNPSAPALPGEQKSEKKKEEKMSGADTVAPSLPSSKQKSAGEKVKDKAPALPKENSGKKLERIGNQEPPKLPVDEDVKSDASSGGERASDAEVSNEKTGGANADSKTPSASTLDAK